MKKDPLNCIFCEAEEKGISFSCYSPEAYEEIRKKHLEEHCKKCPTCGQPIEGELND